MTQQNQKFTESQKIILQSICDTFYPSLSDIETNDIIQEDKAFQIKSGVKYTLERRRLVMEFCKRNAESVGTADKVEELFFKQIPSDIIFQTNLLFSALSTSLGTFALSFGTYYTPFNELPLESRVDILSNFASSWIPDLRKGFNSLKGLISLVFLSTTTATTKRNPSWDVLKYDRPLSNDVVEAERKKSQRKEFQYKMLNDDFASNDNNHGATADTDDQVIEMDVDIVIVGTGCGGSVMASVLSEIKGLKIVVIEKAEYLIWQDMEGTEEHGFNNMYEKGGVLITEDTGIAVLAGSAFGGGTAVNWACSLRTPGFVREEWEHFGLKRFGPSSTSFSKAIDYVCNRIGVVEGNDITHNITNQLFLDGCKACGYSAEATGQNMKNTSTYKLGSGDISIGDKFGIKNSTPETFLQDAANNGCQFIDQCYIDTIMHDGKKASGVVGKFIVNDKKNGLVIEKKIKITARKGVIISCGAINTPALLLRSKVPNSNGLIGKNLRLHPVVGCVAALPKEIKVWDGAPMTTVSNAASGGSDGSHYGVKLECPSVHVGFGGAQLPWLNPKQNRRDLLFLPNSFVTIALSRDKGSGSIQIDSDGNARLYYPLSQHDRDSLVEGSEMLIRISAAVGAEKILSSVIPLNGVVDLPNEEGKEEERREKIDEYVEKMAAAGVTANFKNVIISAHQMGTAKMSNKPSQGVCKDTGELHEVENLYVADTSLFPTPSGANPMITCLALTYDIALRLKQKIMLDIGGNGSRL